MHKNISVYRKCHSKCEQCRATSDLLVHHKDYDRGNNEFSNFTVLCRSCHSVIHKRIRNILKMRHLYDTRPEQLTFRFY